MRKKFLLVAMSIILATSIAQAKKVEEVVELHPKPITSTVPSAFYSEQTRNFYKLRSGDQLSIVIFGYDELSSPGNGTTPYVVRPDGKFYLPLIGEVDVRGRTVPDICDEIESRYSKYLRSPKVDINIIKLGKIHVCVLGQVARQGLYEFEYEPKLLDAISSAAGFTDKASKKNIFVIRAGEQEPCLKIDLRKFLKGELTGQNITLNEGDCVYITSNHKISFAKDIYPVISSIYYIDNMK